MSEFNNLSPEEAEEQAVKYIRKGMQDDDIEMVLVVCNTRIGMASILSLKMDEEDVAFVLAAASATLLQQQQRDPQDRTLN
jgi:hypothetical protein